MSYFEFYIDINILAPKTQRNPTEILANNRLLKICGAPDIPRRPIPKRRSQRHRKDYRRFDPERSLKRRNPLLPHFFLGAISSCEQFKQIYLWVALELTYDFSFLESWTGDRRVRVSVNTDLLTLRVCTRYQS
jgi:hypothetical protein